MSVQALPDFKRISEMSAVDITPQNTEFSSLDDRLRDAFASLTSATQAEYVNIMAKANSPRFLSEPGGLFELQVQLGEYKQKIETISALTRKGVDVATTLLRA